MLVHVKEKDSDAVVKIVLDRASWHRASKITESKFGKYLLFTPPKRPEYNLVELYFSAVRDKFRRRKQVNSVEEELGQIFEIFRNCDDPKSFSGYRRQILRNIIEAADKAISWKK